jgi:hypothetical protein
MKDFYSIGVCFYNGRKLLAVYPLNIILFPLALLFHLDAPIYTITEYDDEQPSPFEQAPTH